MPGVLVIFRHDLGQDLLLRTYETYARFRTTVVFDKLPQISCAYMFPKAILKDLLTPDPFVSHADIWHQVPEQIFAPMYPLCEDIAKNIILNLLPHS